jgi:hypothetical protein
MNSSSGFLWPSISQRVGENLLSHDPVLYSMCMLYIDSDSYEPSFQVDNIYNI